MLVLQELDGFLMEKDDFIRFLNHEFKQWTFQEERGMSGRLHYQCAAIANRKTRPTTIIEAYKVFCATNGLRRLPGALTVQPMAGTYEQGVKYCIKSETRIRGPWSTDMLYVPWDIDRLNNRERAYEWQNTLFDYFIEPNSRNLKKPDNRTIHWVFDKRGNTGKSLWVKYMCFTYLHCVKISFNTASQLRKGIAKLGKKHMYIIDIPRTVARDDSMDDMLTVIEDLKNGHITSTMYGEYSELLMNSPHVIIFSNQLPDVSKLSKDRWKIWTIQADMSLFQERLDSLPQRKDYTEN